MKVLWTEHKTNEEILQMVETKREIMDTIRSRQKRWLSHILRHDSLLRITLEGQIQGKKAYGRPRTMLLDWLLKTEEGNSSYEELKMSAQDRSRWSQWRWKPAIWQNTAERERGRGFNSRFFHYHVTTRTSRSHTSASDTKYYNLALAKGRRCSATGKSTAVLAESNSSLYYTCLRVPPAGA